MKTNEERFFNYSEWGESFMERTMSVEDKIRRAEEIYNRKRENEYKNTNTRERVDNTKSNRNQNIN